MEFKVLFSSVNPFGGVFVNEFREMEFKGGIRGARLRVGFGGLGGITDRKGVDVSSIMGTLAWALRACRSVRIV